MHRGREGRRRGLRVVYIVLGSCRRSNGKAPLKPLEREQERTRPRRRIGGLAVTNGRASGTGSGSGCARCCGRSGRGWLVKQLDRIKVGE